MPLCTFLLLVIDTLTSRLIFVYAQSIDPQSIPAIQSSTTSSAIFTSGKDGSISSNSSINIQDQNTTTTILSYSYIPDQLAENSSPCDLKIQNINLIYINVQSTK